MALEIVTEPLLRHTFSSNKKKKMTGKNKVTHREGTIIEPYCLLEALLHIIFGLKAASKVVIISLLEDETKAQEKLINLPTNIRPRAKQRYKFRSV